MVKKIDMIEAIVTAICLLFAVAISLYHVSKDGKFGLSQEQWRVVWAISENGLLLTMSFVIGIFGPGILRNIFRFVFAPYFLIKLIYHFSCFSGIYIISGENWKLIWSSVCVLVIVVSLLILLINRKRWLSS